MRCGRQRALRPQHTHRPGRIVRWVSGGWLVGERWFGPVGCRARGTHTSRRRPRRKKSLCPQVFRVLCASLVKQASSHSTTHRSSSSCIRSLDHQQQYQQRNTTRRDSSPRIESTATVTGLLLLFPPLVPHNTSERNHSATTDATTKYYSTLSVWRGEQIALEIHSCIDSVPSSPIPPPPPEIISHIYIIQPRAFIHFSFILH